MNELINPHALGFHSVKCEEDGICTEGIEFNYIKPRVLITTEEVAKANNVLKKISNKIIPIKLFEIGDNCWFDIKD